MTATILYMSMSLDGYIAGPKFREAVPISEVRHKDTAFYRMHKPRWLVLAVVTLLACTAAPCRPSSPPSG